MSLGLDRGVGAIVWSPFGWGRLTGEIRCGQPLPEGSRLHKPADLGPQVPEEYLYTVVDAFDQAAQETGETVPHIALDWLLKRLAVANVIVGAWNEGGVPWPLTIFQSHRFF